MKTVGIRALKQNASAVVAEAASGETVRITSRGRAVAQLIPVPQTRLAALVAAGLARPARRPIRDLGAAPRRTATAPALSDALARMRDAERY